MRSADTRVGVKETTNEEDGAVVGDGKRGGGHRVDGRGSLVGQAECHQVAHGVPGCAGVCGSITLGVLLLLLGTLGQETLLEEREEQVPPRVDTEHSERARGLELNRERQM